MRDDATGICSECTSPPEAYHARSCSQFNGYHCHTCGGTYYGEFCGTCPKPWRAVELGKATAAETIALHWICDCAHGAEDVLENAQHVLDALQAAGFAVVDTGLLRHAGRLLGRLPTTAAPRVMHPEVSAALLAAAGPAPVGSVGEEQ